MSKNNSFSQHVLTEEDVHTLLSSNASVYETYMSFPDKYKKEICDFLVGKSGPNITYDPFFRTIFSPELHQDRLEAFISTLLNMDIEIIQILPREGFIMSEDASFVIMDIIVKSLDGAIINLEIQKVGYMFPGERADCYIADSVMRQYTTLKSKMGKTFSYRDMKPSYLIVIIEQSPKTLLNVAPEFYHKRNVSYSSGANLTCLENVLYISLDTFSKTMQNESISTDMQAWLTLLSSTDINKIKELISYNSMFDDIYKEIFELRSNPKELVYMFSEALRIMDRNTELLMIDEMKVEAEQLNITLAETKSELSSTKTELSSTKTELSSTKTELSSTKTELSSAKTELSSTKTELSSAKTELSSTKTELSSVKTENEELKATIEALTAELGKYKKN